LIFLRIELTTPARDSSTGGVTENIGAPHTAIQAVAVKTARYDVVADVAEQLVSTAASGEFVVAVAANHDIGAAATWKISAKLVRSNASIPSGTSPWHRQSSSTMPHSDQC
jgi:hypothetical protein